MDIYSIYVNIYVNNHIYGKYIDNTYNDQLYRYQIM